MVIKLTQEQRQAVKEHPQRPIEIIDPITQQSYVLVSRDEYERVRKVLLRDREVTAGCSEIASRIPPGIRRSQEAYWREMPDFLPSASRKRQWVAYHGDEQVGIGRTEAELFEECIRRGLSADEVYIGRLTPSSVAPWEAEVIEPSLFEAHAEDSLPDATVESPRQEQIAISDGPNHQ